MRLPVVLAFSWVCVAFLLSFYGQAVAQSNSFAIYSTLETGSGDVLTTAAQSFEADSLQPFYQLQFAFGFATEEQPGPGQLFDSATITLQDTASTATAVYLTVDVNGVTWAPVTPGGVALDPATLVSTPVTYRDASKPWTYQTAYSMSVAVPSQFAGKTVNLYLDLFDNGDALPSLAWISQVPEPSSGALLLLGWLIAFRRRRTRR